MSFSIDKLNLMHLDILKEIGTIGAGNAATSLSKMLKKRVDMDVPAVKIVEFRKLESAVGGADSLVAGIYLEFYGDIQGNILFILGAKSAYNIISLLLGKEYRENPPQTFTELEISLLKELGNILAGAHLGAISSFTGLILKPSVPDFAYDMLGAILSAPMIQFGQVSDKALFIETEFINGPDKINSHFIVMPDMESYPIILKSLGVV